MFNHKIPQPLPPKWDRQKRGNHEIFVWLTDEYSALPNGDQAHHWFVWRSDQVEHIVRCDSIIEAKAFMLGYAAGRADLKHADLLRADLRRQ